VSYKQRRWKGGYTSEQVADYAWAEVTCPDCGAEPKSACIPLPEPPRTVCKGRFIAAAIELKHQRKVPSPSREAQEACARLNLATERGCFMADIPDADVAARLRGDG
jgi:hypothetical protein